MKRSVIDTIDLSKEEVQGLLDTAMDIIADPAKYAHACAGKKLATLFFEPSTRTRMSFEAAMYELGGNVISMTDAGTSSATKGETVADTVKVVSNYVDIIAQRHPKAGAALVSAVNAAIPVINAGDGGHCHPTQTFADLLTIYREYGKMDGLTVGFCGDLLYGRTVHSLMAAMARYSGTKFILISPEELKVPRHLIDDVVLPNAIPCEETASLEEALPKLDVLYMTRIQKERFDDIEQYERLKNSYVLDAEKMKLAKPDCIVMHPLPRVDEIAVDVDEDPRARYFEQTLNGKYMRMALILKLLGWDGNTLTGAKEPEETFPGGPFSLWNEAIEDGAYRCTNPKCICAAERSIRHKYYAAKDGSKRCVYCEQ
ncbi:MAG: aspartate carbamoyltransferase [Firmicutes bacterium]|nr:aspartate carbamoyltransferase [Bacillota bacterium]